MAIRINMENYNDFINRISSFEKSEMSLGCEPFVTNKSLELKVNENNSFNNFYGDTIVFDLNEADKALIADLVDILYREAPECFCEKLSAATFHMTLHDLSNSFSFEDVAHIMDSNEKKLRNVLSKDKISRHIIKMKSKAIFNMVNTSLVVGIYPINETEYEKLMKLYQFADCVQALPYPLTPHITLAYYSRKEFDISSSAKLEKTVNQLNTHSFEFILDTSRLMYQRFNSMNDYRNIFCLNEYFSQN